MELVVAIDKGLLRGKYGDERDQKGPQNEGHSGPQDHVYGAKCSHVRSAYEASGRSV